MLGILVMNIQSFAMVDPSYFNPTVSLDLDGINLAIWWTSHVLADGKFMAIFSMLFGAGIVLSCSRAERRDGRPAKLHYRRTFGLLIFGLLHAYLLWSGDILVWYSLSATVAYLFWRARPGWLLFWSLLLLSMGAGLFALLQGSVAHWPAESIQEARAHWNPTADQIAQRLAAYRGGWLDQMPERALSSATMHTLFYGFWGLWRTLGLMLLGMALFKWGVLSAERSARFYGAVVVIGLAAGLPIVAYGGWQHFAHGWALDYSMFGGTLYNYGASLLVAAAYLSAVMLIVRTGRLECLQRRLAPVGRTAFSGYILQTLVCTTLFFGHGFGMYGRLERWQQVLVVVGTWVAILVLANLWLARFRMGPLEWLWRAMTYGRLPAMRR